MSFQLRTPCNNLPFIQFNPLSFHKLSSDDLSDLRSWLLIIELLDSISHRRKYNHERPKRERERQNLNKITEYLIHSALDDNTKKHLFSAFRL